MSATGLWRIIPTYLRANIYSCLLYTSALQICTVLGLLLSTGVVMLSKQVDFMGMQVDISICFLVPVSYTHLAITKAQCLMPFQTDFFPFLEPVKFRSRFYEELHFHLLSLIHISVLRRAIADSLPVIGNIKNGSGKAGGKPGR